jgi:HrpA-like RNA helicase
MEEAERASREGESNGHIKIVVTQPRRMAAITLARRVASELDEDIGKTVGYKISGDSVSGKLCFATTGFLLQVLVNQPEEFGTYSHVILDEVHERSVDADLLTMLMKLLMQCYPEVKLIVMSATLQAKLFAEYFAALETDLLGGGVGRRARRPPKYNVEPIFVGVRTYPVEEIFLDEIDDHFNISGGFARQAIDKALRAFSGMGKGGKGGKGKGKDKGKGKGANNASGFKRLEPQITEGFDEVCRELVQQMAREECTLIVFLPGIADITQFYECLAPYDSARQEKRALGSDSANWREDFDAVPGTAGGRVSLRIYPMHSLIPREEQEEVFSAPPKGVCHVVLASNIAESSLTLPSVCGIIDLAMRRSIQYDARRLMSCLVTTWCSQSSCKQRAGRAGRTMPGRAVRMVTRPFFEDMVEFDPPEMLNAPLTKLYLQAKQLCVKLDNLYNQGSIPDGIDMDLSTPTLLLGEVVQPPATVLIEAAIAELAAVGCIDRPSEDALITPLGYMAMALPCELRLCRLLYVGLLLGCPCDAIAMVAGLTAADPFSTPSLLVLKDEREYCKKLERSFAARRWCDHGRHSEPLMLRDLFAEWIQAGAPRGSRAIGGFARDWSVIPKKFEALACEAVDLCSRVVKLLNPRSSGHQAIQRLLATMRFTVDRREELSKVYYPPDSDYKKLFSEDVSLMRALLCAAFSDQILLQLKPRWAPSGGGKKKKEEQMLQIMKQQELNYSSTVIFLNPPQELRQWDAEENFQKLCEAMCGERAARVHFDDREKLLFYDFKSAPLRKRGKNYSYQNQEQDVEPGFDQSPCIADVCPQAHRLHQFGAGRYKFNVESPVELQSGGGWGGAENEYGTTTLELFKPLQPFLIHWEVIQHTTTYDAHTGKKSSKKPAAVKAMPDWRNPLGFACNARADLPAEELVGVCASVQGLEAGGSAFVAGATALGLNYLPLLLTTLDPVKWQVEWGFDANGEVQAIKIMNVEIVLPPDTITADVIWKINQVRAKFLESLAPWGADDTAPDMRNHRRGGKGGPKGRDRQAPNSHIWVGDASKEMSELLENLANA